MGQVLSSLRNWGLGALMVVCLVLGVLLLTESGVVSAEPLSAMTTTADSTTADTSVTTDTTTSTDAATTTDAAATDEATTSPLDSPLGASKSGGKITLTMDDVELPFGEVEAGATVTCPTPVCCRVKCNRDWSLLYQASGFDAANGLPLSQLRWGTRPDGSDSVPLSASGVFLSGERITGPGLTITHYYTLEMPWEAVPGEYTATIIYTAVAD